MQSAGSKNIYILFFTLIVVMLGFGIIIPIMPFYVKSFGASGRALGLLMATYGAMQFICAPLWGSLSDRFGRKPILIMGVAGNAISHLLFGLSTDLWMLFAARSLAGILSSATMPTAMAYISDSTSEHDRGGGMGMLSAAVGLGVVLGPGIGGWLAGRSLALPFFLASALSAAAVLLLAAYLPESLPLERRRQHHEARRSAGPGAMWNALLGPLAFLLVLSMLLDFGLTNFESVFGLYALECYKYGPVQVGTVLVLVGLISAIMQGALAGPLSRRWGEEAVIKVSMACCAVSFVLLLVPRSFPGILLAVGFHVVSNSLLRPCVSSLISKQAPGGQGMAMGLNNSFMSLGRIIGPICAGLLFDIRTSLPYISGAIVLAAGFAGCMVFLQRAPDRKLPPV